MNDSVVVDLARNICFVVLLVLFGLRKIYKLEDTVFGALVFFSIPTCIVYFIVRDVLSNASISH